jgi:hypothetical protein
MVDAEGDAVGEITHIYLNRDNNQPEWALVAVPERGQVFVPLSGSGRRDDRVRVAVAKAAVRDAPEIPSGRELSERDEARLYSHYGKAGQPDDGAKRAAAAGGRAREVATSAPAKRLLSAAGAASVLGATAAAVGRSGRHRRGGPARMLDGLLAAPGAALQRRRRRQRVATAGRLLAGAATAPLRALTGLGTEIGRRTPAPPRPISRRRRSKMAGNVKLTVGLVSGYVLGARAGRERYERLLDVARQVAEHPEVQQLTDKVRTSLGAGMDKATSAAGDRLERARRDMGSQDGPGAETVEAAGQAEANQHAGMAGDGETARERRPLPTPSRPSSPRSGRREQRRTDS